MKKPYDPARPAQAPKAFALKQLKKFKTEARGRNK
jgi:hypothetical protein